MIDFSLIDNTHESPLLSLNINEKDFCAYIMPYFDIIYYAIYTY